MSDPLNTHTYDGNLDCNLIPSLVFVKELTQEQKQKRGSELVEHATGLDAKAIHFLREIVNSIGTPANFDNTNSLSADDLICLCWDQRDNPEFMNTLETQLMDMETGFCPQGRTHRLFQTLLAFKPLDE